VGPGGVLAGPSGPWGPEPRPLSGFLRGGGGPPPPPVAVRNSPKVISRPAERGNEHLLQISFINQDLPENVLPSLFPVTPPWSTTIVGVPLIVNNEI